MSSKGKKVTVLADVWTLAKKQPEKNKGLTLDKYKKSKGEISNDKIKFKEGMKVSWVHPKAGKGSGIISNLSGNIATIEKVVGSNGQPGKPVRLPIDFLKPIK